MLSVHLKQCCILYLNKLEIKKASRKKYSHLFPGSWKPDPYLLVCILFHHAWYSDFTEMWQIALEVHGMGWICDYDVGQNAEHGYRHFTLASKHVTLRSSFKKCKIFRYTNITDCITFNICIPITQFKIWNISTFSSEEILLQYLVFGFHPCSVLLHIPLSNILPCMP